MNDRPELRIGDTEREAAGSALGEHFASGRLTREEYDERSSAAWSARTNSDLWPLFVDLPAAQVPHGRPATSPVGRGGPESWRGRWETSAATRRRPRTPFLLVVLLIVVLVLALPGPPWLLILLGWLWFSGAFSRGWHRTHHR